MSQARKPASAEADVHARCWFKPSSEDPRTVALWLSRDVDLWTQLTCGFFDLWNGSFLADVRY